MCRCCCCFFCCCNHSEAKQYTYSELLRGVITSKNYEATAHAAFCTLTSKKHLAFRTTQFVEDGQEEELGWKFHISFDYSDFDARAGFSRNVEDGWNAIIGILIKHNIARTKISFVHDADSNLAEDLVAQCECGRHITIYAELNNYTPEKWNAILQEINDALVRKNIRPGYRSPKTKEVVGSAYISYRNDKMIDAENGIVYHVPPYTQR